MNLNKKELKEQIKAKRDQGYPRHINLTIASMAELQAFLEIANSWVPPEPEEAPEPPKITDVTPVLEQIKAAATLSQLGAAVAQLGGKGEWSNWQTTYWCKNGECRIYVIDTSYINPKQRGYIKIHANGSYKRCWKGVDGFPPLPPLPGVENDLTRTSTDPMDRAISVLNQEFGIGGWVQADLDDELEREEYQ